MPQILAALNDYVDSDLDPAVFDALEEHLADCNPCQIVVDNIRQTIALFSRASRWDCRPPCAGGVQQRCATAGR